MIDVITIEGLATVSVEDPSVGDAQILCATHRLARRLSLAGEGAIRRQRAATTISLWLDAQTEAALLCGRIKEARRRLSRPQERLLWRQVVDEVLDGASLADLLDRDGLVDAAIEANALIETWEVAAGGGHHDDARQFLRWRDAFRRRCDAGGWLDAARYQRWQVEWLVAAPALPQRIIFAGFDRFNPMEQRLIRQLHANGVAVAVQKVEATPARLNVVACESPEAELAAAVAWAKQRWREDAGARVGIVVPDLAARRAALVRLLDEAFLPDSCLASGAAMQRPYNLSLGEPLTDAPGVETALGLLRLAIPGARVAQRDLRDLLLSPWWQGGVGEALGRAQLDADLREHLPPEVELDAVVRRTWRLHYRHGGIEGTARALADLVAEGSRWRSIRLPSVWAEAFSSALESAGWPGERPAVSHEFQAQEAFADALHALGGLDELAGKVTAGEALRLFAAQCREAIFQPRTEGNPRLQVLGLLEAATESFDALWVCGMSEANWPPPARPNPFLHPAAQRAAGSPNASGEVQFAFAQALHARLMGAAATITFSWAVQEEGREQLPSSLLSVPRSPSANEPGDAATSPEFQALAAALQAKAGRDAIECIEDRFAPPVADGEVVRGGTQLLRAQAACPAWGYYQFRLGARALKTPVEGLDNSARGTVVHAVLEAFWRDRDSGTVFGWDGPTLALRIDEAVAGGIAAFEQERDEALPPRFRALEAARLALLLAEWLAVERQRAVPFTVEGCELERHLTLRGLPIRVVADRVDRLADGRLVIIDYKTGRVPSLTAWSGERIAEPQLPIYAAGSDGEPVGAVAFADLRQKPPRFTGLAADDGVLPGVMSVDASRRQFDAAAFPDWDGVLSTWRDRLMALADEIHAGDAAVRVDNAEALAFADVLPLLRLAERDWLFDAADGEPGSPPECLRDA